MDSSKKFVILHGFTHNNTFFTTNTPGKDQTKLKDGTVAYEVLGYHNTVEGSQDMICKYMSGILSIV